MVDSGNKSGRSFLPTLKEKASPPESLHKRKSTVILPWSSSVSNWAGIGFLVWSIVVTRKYSFPCRSVLGFCKPLKHSEKQIYPRVERYKKVQLWILTARHDFGVCATLKSQIIFNNSLRLFNRWILAILSVCQLQWAKRECFLSVKRGRQNDRNRVFCTAVVSWML